LTLNSTTQAATFANTVNALNTFGFENRIINGGMTIDQRNAGASVTITASAAQYITDRFIVRGTQASKLTAQQNAGAVTPPTGFINYLGTTSSSAYTVLTGDFFVIEQRIEGLNVADLAWGTASAKTITLSAWVRSSLTGTFGGSVGNSALNRTYPFSFTISSANTWTQISVTIPGDTSGTWLTTNGIGIAVFFNLGSGATYTGTAGAWSANTYLAPTGAVSVVGTSGATFYLTGVQLEVGSQATSFDFRDYGRELILCQRYYQKTDILGVGAAGGSGNDIFMSSAFPVVMRTAPTASVAGTQWNITDGYAADANATSPTILSTDRTSPTSIRCNFGGFSGMTYGRFYYWRPSTTSYLGLSAEL
jgi:hypothetical protein